MKTPRPLERLLARSLGVALLRRGIVWLACTVLLLTAGGILAPLAGQARLARLGLIMAALSALPAFLLWPLPEKRLLDRLRSFDDETVFEACLESEPGPVQDILQRLAEERAATLMVDPPPREPVMAGLGWLCAAAVLCLALAEGGSLVFLGRPASLAGEAEKAREGGRRLEDRGFSEFAAEDPDVRLARRKEALDRARSWNRPEAKGENPELGLPGKETSPEPPPLGGGVQSGGRPGPDRDAVAKRRQGERGEDAAGGASAQAAAPGAMAGQGRPRPVEVEAPGGQGRDAGRENPWGRAPEPSPTRGRGYEHTPDTKVPSPLLDYRARFEARYTERMGGRAAAGGRLGLGELRDFQRRYFESFTLKAEVGAADDPYVAQLKRRWAEARGGLK